MRPEHHFVVSTLVAGSLWGWTGNVELAFGSAVSGVMLDLDHVPDYLLQYRKATTISHFLEACLNKKLHRAYLVLHSWELVLASGLVCMMTEPGSMLGGLFLGFLQHMILDQVANRPHPWAYWLAWRASKGFELKTMFPG